MKKIFALLLPLFLMVGMVQPMFAGAANAAGSAPVFSASATTSKPTLKETLKLRKELKKQNPAADDNQLLAAVIAFFIPPLGLLIYQGDLTKDFWICLILSLLLWLPGFIYALFKIYKG